MIVEDEAAERLDEATQQEVSLDDAA